MNRLFRALAFAALTLPAVACIGSPKQTVQFLTLPAAADLPDQGGDDLRDFAIGIGPFSVAPYLERASLAYRLDETRVEFSDSAQWAAPVNEMIAERMISRLVVTAGTTRLTAYPWPPSRLPDIQVTLRVLEFSVLANGDVNLVALWALRDPETGRSVASGAWNQSGTPDGVGSGAQVRALGALVDDLTDFLGAELVAALGD
jgi:uncharacterized lipoprotein YmbA